MQAADGGNWTTKTRRMQRAQSDGAKRVFVVRGWATAEVGGETIDKSKPARFFGGSVGRATEIGGAGGSRCAFVTVNEFE